jgi:hypothetical protein
VLTVYEGGKTGVANRRLANLKRATEEAGGRHRFWFSNLAKIAHEDVLSAAIWKVAGSSELFPILQQPFHS